jgi:hypothetical protein
MLPGCFSGRVLLFHLFQEGESGRTCAAAVLLGLEAAAASIESTFSGAKTP